MWAGWQEVLQTACVLAKMLCLPPPLHSSEWLASVGGTVCQGCLQVASSAASEKSRHPLSEVSVASFSFERDLLDHLNLPSSFSPYSWRP